MAKAPKTRPSPAAEKRKFQAQYDLRTLREAQDIAIDKTRMARAQSEGVKQMKALGKVVKKKR